MKEFQSDQTDGSDTYLDASKAWRNHVETGGGWTKIDTKCDDPVFGSLPGNFGSFLFTQIPRPDRIEIAEPDRL